jgi:hypothetical protein
MNLPDALWAIVWIVGYFGLFVGCIGQVAFTAPVLRPHLPAWIGWIGVVTVMLPWLIVFTITFFNHPFLSPRAFRFCLVLAMCFFALFTIVTEVLCHFGYMPPDSPAYARTISRVLMHMGWFSFIPLGRLYVITRRYESKRDA